MPGTDVVFYRDDDGGVPVLEWLDALRRRDKRVYAKCHARIMLLESDGHELRRPLCDYLRDGIYELRIRFGEVNYRILYFFAGRTAAVLAHGTTKEDRVAERDVELAVLRKAKFENDPEGHTHDKD